MGTPSLPAGADALIAEIVRLVMARLAGEAIPGFEAARPVLFVLTGSAFGHDAALDLLKSANSRGPIEVFAAPCYFERNGGDALAAALPDVEILRELPTAKHEATLKRVAAAVFLLSHRAVLSKVARGLADTSPTLLLSEALMRGIPTFAAGGDYHPDAWPKTTPTLMRRGSQSIGDLAERDQKRLQAWGMIYKLEPAELLGPILDAWKLPRRADGAPLPPGGWGAADMVKPPSGFVTITDLRQLHSQGVRHLRLAPGVRMTDAAREELLTLSMTIEE
jgi:hypothetical protein